MLFDKPTYEKLYKEVPQYKLITPAVVSERLKVRGSLARRALIELREKGMVSCSLFHALILKSLLQITLIKCVIDWTYVILFLVHKI